MNYKTFPEVEIYHPYYKLVDGKYFGKTVNVEVLTLHLKKMSMRVRIKGTNQTFDTDIEPFILKYKIVER